MTKTLIIYYTIIFVEMFLARSLNNYNCQPDMCFEHKKRFTIQIYQKQLNVSFIYIIMLLVPTLLVGLRYGIGQDFENYTRIIDTYSHINGLSLDMAKSMSYEVGFYYLCKVVFWIGGSTQVVFFVTALASFILLFKVVIDRSKGLDSELLVLITMVLFLAPSMNIIKQVLACGIVFNALKYVEKREFLKYIVLVVIASTFHISAIIFLPLYFLNIESGVMGKFKERIVFVFIASVPFFFERIFTVFVGIEGFSGYAIYSNLFSTEVNWKVIIYYLPIYIPILFSWKKLVNYDKNNRFYLIILVLEIVSKILGFYMHWSMRLMYYFIISEIILVPRVVSLSKRYQLLLKLYFVFFYLLYFYFTFFVWKNDGIVPYKAIF